MWLAIVLSSALVTAVVVFVLRHRKITRQIEAEDRLYTLSSAIESTFVDLMEAKPLPDASMEVWLAWREKLFNLTDKADVLRQEYQQMVKDRLIVPSPGLEQSIVSPEQQMRLVLLRLPEQYRPKE